MSALRGKIPYTEFSTRGMLKAKPLGTFYELFQSNIGGMSIWVNPTEYTNLSSNFKEKRRYIKEDPKTRTTLGETNKTLFNLQKNKKHR